MSTEQESIRAIAAVIRDYNPAYIVIAARGTSDNAARYAQYLFGVRAGLVVSLATPSVHTLYDRAPTMRGALVIGISQSGASDDIRQVLTDANEEGALTLAITNDLDSPLAQIAAHHIDIHAGYERSVAATKTYTAELAAVAMLVATLVDDSQMRDELATVPPHMQQTLDTTLTDVPRWVQRYRYMAQYAVIGRGYNYATAFEISLKIKELCYITGEQYSEADFRHGPMALIEAGYPVMMVMPEGIVYPRQLDLLRQLHEREAETLVISNQPDAQQYATQFMRLLAGVPEWVSPMVGVIPGQVFAMELARARGLSLDKPRGLKKVTMTQ